MAKGHFLLDLDQTLISAEPTEEYNFDKNKGKAKKFKFHDMDGYYVVFERPGLQEFLDFLFDNFTVSIWTAASKDYALFVIEKIVLAGKKNRKLDFVFFSYHCDLSEKYKNGTKDLSMLWDVYRLSGYTQENTVILDDYDEVYETQPKNCILAFPFEFTKDSSPDDKFLSELIPYLRKIKQDVQKGKSVQPEVEKINQHFDVLKKVKKNKK